MVEIWTKLFLITPSRHSLTHFGVDKKKDFLLFSKKKQMKNEISPSLFTSQFQKLFFVPLIYHISCNHFLSLGIFFGVKNAMSSLVGQLHLNTFCFVKTISNLLRARPHLFVIPGSEKLNRVFSNDTTCIIRQRELFVSSK